MQLNIYLPQFQTSEMKASTSEKWIVHRHAKIRESRLQVFFVTQEGFRELTGEAETPSQLEQRRIMVQGPVKPSDRLTRTRPSLTSLSNLLGLK